MRWGRKFKRFNRLFGIMIILDRSLQHARFLLSRRKEKVFVVGLNKTGTTSVEDLLKAAGFRLADQRALEKLTGRWLNGDLSDQIFERRLKRKIRLYEGFQDVPFSIPALVPFLWKNYPDARFILTIRSSGEEWASSLEAEFQRWSGDLGRSPSWSELERANYRVRGFPALLLRKLGADPAEPIEFQSLASIHDDYVKFVGLLTKLLGRRMLLVLDLKDPDCLAALEDFLGRPTGLSSMPHSNRRAARESEIERVASPELMTNEERSGGHR